jgi:hypothetical protein
MWKSYNIGNIYHFNIHMHIYQLQIINTKFVSSNPADVDFSGYCRFLHWGHKLKDDAMAKDKGQTKRMVDKTLHRKLGSEQHEPY